MAGWGAGRPIAGASTGSVPVVSVRRPRLQIKEIHFATTSTGSTDFHYLYYGSNTHPLLGGKNLQWWGRGSKITVPEWVNGRRNLRACFTRNKPVAMAVKLVARTTASLPGSLAVTPTLDGSTRHVTAALTPFTYPANAAEHWVNITLGGTLPDEVGRYVLRLEWNVTGSGFRFSGPRRTRHRIYGIYGQPLDPAYDSASTSDTGHPASQSDGTVSGTRKRLDHMMHLIGGRMRRHSVATQDEVVDLYWELHKGINDTPGAPPYFDAGHNQHMTVDGTDSGTEIPLEDQWLAWVRNSRHWNDASCIGHVQLAKTMLASVGLFARRTWVFPHTTKLPDGSTASFSDTDYYCLGTYNTSKEQTATLKHSGRNYTATAKLMEPGQAWENFEACMLSPTGKFLTGGYNTSSNPASFRANKGFNSAEELLRWWCNTSRRGFGKRFIAWVYANDSTGEYHIWDVDGTHYDFDDYVQIRNRGKQLPPP